MANQASTSMTDSLAEIKRCHNKMIVRLSTYFSPKPYNNWDGFMGWLLKYLKPDDLVGDDISWYKISNKLMALQIIGYGSYDKLYEEFRTTDAKAAEIIKETSEEIKDIISKAEQQRTDEDVGQQHSSGDAFSPGVDERRQSKGDAFSPGVDEQRQSKGTAFLRDLDEKQHSKGDAFSPGVDEQRQLKGTAFWRGLAEQQHSKGDALSPGVDERRQSKGNESKMSDLMIQPQLDGNCEQDFLNDSKGFPFNVARLLAIKFKVEERFVVPAIDILGKHVFIVYDKEQGKDRITTELGQTVLFRNPISIQSEGLEITNYCREIRLVINPSQRTLLKRIIQQHADELFTKHSNINFIAMSPVKSWRNGNNVRNQACIVIYCSSKGYIPFGERHFPTKLSVGEETFSTDIREGYFQFGPYAYTTSRSSDTHDRLKMGCQFGVEGGSGAGTVGPFVNFNGNMAFLTCAHIIYGIDENGYTYDDPLGSVKIEQPASVNFGSIGLRCGVVKRAVFKPNLPSSVDAAVIEITEHSRQPARGEFAVDNPIRMQQAGFDDLPSFNSGIIHMNPNTIDSDKRMVKFGSETHVTRGTLISEGTVVTPMSTEMGLFGHTGRKVLMRNQMEIAGLTSHGAFFQPGDSGSGVFFVDRTGMGQELTCIGMAIGSTSNGTAIVTPILDILDALQLPRSLWQFP